MAKVASSCSATASDGCAFSSCVAAHRLGLRESLPAQLHSAERPAGPLRELRSRVDRLFDPRRRVPLRGRLLRGRPVQGSQPRACGNRGATMAASASPTDYDASRVSSAASHHERTRRHSSQPSSRRQHARRAPAPRDRGRRAVRRRRAAAGIRPMPRSIRSNRSASSFRGPSGTWKRRSASRASSAYRSCRAAPALRSAARRWARRWSSTPRSISTA